MPFLICPDCGAENPLTAEICQVCGASLADVIPMDMDNSEADDGENDEFTLFSAEDKDLPELLNDLKQDHEPAGGGLPEIDLAGEGESSEVDDTPEWLDVIRKRAHEELDAAGEMTQRIVAAQESLTRQNEEERADYASWIEELRKETREEAVSGTEGQEEEPLEGPAPEKAKKDWLSRVRKASGKLETHDEPNAASRNLLDWLVALEEEQTGGMPSGEAGVTQPVDLRQRAHADESTREVRVGDGAQPLVAPKRLDLSREEREQADLLATTIADESTARPVQPITFGRRRWWVEFILAFFLIGGICFVLFSGRLFLLPQPPVSSGSQALLNSVADLPEDAELLLVFDYQPAFAGELEWVAAPVLEALPDSVKVSVISTSASGPLLADSMLERLEIIPAIDLGYLPAEAFGAYGLAAGLASTQAAEFLPEGASGLFEGEFHGILILSDNAEHARVWVEQLSALTPETPLNLLVTAQAGPMLRPYVDSGQVTGMMAGISDAAGLETSRTQGPTASQRWQAYQVGLLTLIGVLILGVLLNLRGGATQGDDI